MKQTTLTSADIPESHVLCQLQTHLTPKKAGNAFIAWNYNNF